MEIMRVFRRDSVGALVVRDGGRLRPRSPDAARMLLALVLIVLVTLVAMLGTAPEAGAQDHARGSLPFAMPTGHPPRCLDVERISGPSDRG